MPILRNTAIVVFLVWILLDGIAVMRLMTGAAENRDRSSLKVLLAVGSLTWTISIGLTFGSFATLHWPRLQIAGLVLMALGIAIRTTAIMQLGRLHTPNVAIREDHQLKTDGLYRLVRHPSYSGALIAFLGFGLALGNWMSLLLIAAITPAIYLYRIAEEDAALLAAFGDAYRDYCGRTKKLIPWIY